MTKFEKVQTFLETNAQLYKDPQELAWAAMQSCNVGIFVDVATPGRSHLPGAEGRLKRTCHAFQVFYLRSGKWLNKSAGWIYLDIERFGVQ